MPLRIIKTRVSESKKTQAPHACEEFATILIWRESICGDFQNCTKLSTVMMMMMMYSICL
jgi:hypothetical protein